MISDTARFGSFTYKSTVNSATGKPNQAAGGLLKIGGYLRGFEGTNYTLDSYYVLFFDQPLPPANNLALTDPAYKPPKLVIQCQPATANNALGRTVKTDLQLRDAALYKVVPPETKATDYFKNGISFVISTDPARYVAAAGVYPVAIDIQVAPAKVTGFNPDKHWLNVGQETHPAKPAVTIDGIDYPAILDKQFDLRPGGDLEKNADRWLADGRKNIRFNYVAFTFSQLENWKLAALYLKSRGFNVLLGWTYAGVGYIDQARFDAGVAAIPALVQWAAENGFKYIDMFNEEDLHSNKNSTFTMNYIVSKLFELSVTCKSWLNTNGYTDVVLSGSWSWAGYGEVSRLYQLGTLNGFDEIHFNVYSLAQDFVTRVADLYAIFGPKLMLTEVGPDLGINSFAGNENEHAIDHIIRRNVVDYFGIKYAVFADDDSGLTPANQHGLYVKSTNHKRKAYTALLEV